MYDNLKALFAELVNCDRLGHGGETNTLSLYAVNRMGCEGLAAIQALENVPPPRKR